MLANDDTIIALATPRGKSGVAVLRASGPDLRPLLKAFCLSDLTPGRLHLRHLKDARSEEVLDEALVARFVSPSSFTGEDVLEIHCHGSLAVIDGILDVALAVPDVRVAERGEFTARAFWNRKMDLTQVEGLADLIESETAEQRRQSLSLVDGALLKRIDSLTEQLETSLSLIEASLDFADEDDVGEDAESKALAIAQSVCLEIDSLLANTNGGEIVRDGFHIAIGGPPNVGKSSLMNALLGRDAVIVSEIAGTTRDVHETVLDVSGFKIHLYDTAGLRETDDPIEKEGTVRAHKKIMECDLLWWLIDLSNPMSQMEVPHFSCDSWTIGTKSDLVSSPPYPPDFDSEPVLFPVSSKTGDGLEALLKMLEDRLYQAAGPLSDRIVVRRRQSEGLKACHNHLVSLQRGGQGLPELRAEAIRRALNDLSRLTGQYDVEAILGRIFSGFCIGK